MRGERVALVTGSARGIGRAVLLGLAGCGFAVAVHYRSSEAEAERTRTEAEALGVRAIKLRADVTELEQARCLVEQVVGQLGGLHVLVNNVGDYLKKPVEELTAREWQSLLDSNLNAPFYVTQAALPHLRAAGWGRVVNIGYAGRRTWWPAAASCPMPSPRPG